MSASSTRCSDPLAALRLAPLLDMANRGETSRNEPDVAGLGIFGGKGLRVLADRDYSAGQEVGVGC